MNDLDKEFTRSLAGRYEIDEEIGRGAMAAVYAARDLRHQRRVAIKVLRNDSTLPMSDVRFVREIKFLSQLQHPNILPLYDSGMAAGYLYYVMPHVRGETLGTRMRRNPRLTPRDIVRIVGDVGEALDHAHRHGVVHRDIKPDNILLLEGRAVVADFGIARAIGAAGVGQVTTVGSVAPGTPSYMSPEQLLGGQDVDGRSDVYSLGIVLYEALAGELPFVGSDGRCDNSRKMSSPPPQLRIRRPDLPSGIDRVIARVLACEPRDRFGSAQEFVEALRSTLDATPAGSEAAPGAAPAAAARPPWVWAAAGVAAAAAVVALLMALGVLRV
jgi:serine/threonine-protein kinase